MTRTASDLVAEIKQQYPDINPILVLAPVQRCGSTLLQRVINVGGEAIIYGENFLFLEKIPLLAGGPVQNYAEKFRISSETTQAFLAGQKNLDATALFPDYENYAREILMNFYRVADFYQRTSENYGYQHWGFKHQIVQKDGVNNAINLFPKRRLLCIYRNLIDVARSHKSRWPNELATTQQLAAYGHRWAVNLEYILNISHTKLVIKYEELIADTQSHADKIESYLGIKIDRDEFGHKVNAHYTIDDIKTGAIKDVSKGGNYKPPVELSPAEITALLTHARPLFERLGYSA